MMVKKTKDIIGMRKDAGIIFQSGLKAVEPGAAVKKYCHIKGENLIVGKMIYDLSGFKNLFVIGFGKAAAPMAKAFEDLLGERITGGIINVKYGHLARLERIATIEAGHPVPDSNGEKGAGAIVKIAQDAGKDDMVICLISGGGSALLPLPAEGLTLEDKQNTINVLLACGATIYEINTIRKHMSFVKGGRLAQLSWPATFVSVILSDVVGDDTDVIASGCCVPDPSTFSDCMVILNKYGILRRIPQAVVSHIKAGISDPAMETPKPGSPYFKHTHNLIVGNNIKAILAARNKAEDLQYNTIVLSSMIEGETKDVAKVHTAIAKEVLKTGLPVTTPACIISGGETTVTIKGKGKGGRNQEFVLSAAIDIAGKENIVVLSGGTDGNDGPTDAAGAVADCDTLKRAEVLGMNPGNFLKNNDSYNFFQKLDDLLVTGPTNTNVMDLRIMLIG